VGNNLKKITFNLLTTLLSVVIILGFLELILKIKNKFIMNYDIEMWKYAKELKVPHNNKKINHIHKKDSKAKLQNVEIAINSYGFREKNFKKKDWDNATEKIIFLGSSVTLGWGVKEEKNLTSLIEKIANSENKNWKIINAAVGNYNTERYINNFFEFYERFDPDVIVVQYFINDAEVLDNKKGNFFTRNFHLGVELWKYIALFNTKLGETNIQDHYKKVYKFEEQSKIVFNELKKLSNFCNKQKKNCYVIFTPDLKLFKRHDLNFIKDYMEKMSKELNFKFFDITNLFSNYDEDMITNIKFKDRHPNELAHEIMAKAIYNYLLN
tara:strand:- start:19437 stop:20411 length:975 start_codon:yes stop_codon:yes gene_type:complete